MQTYTVHEPPKSPGSHLKRADRLVFVREGFSWWAALLAPLWMLVHRMWLVLLFYLVGVTVLDAALVTAGFSTQAVALATIAVHLALGFEAGTLRRWSLDRKGWRMLGVVTGQSKIDCERRFFHAWLGEKGEEQDAGTVQLSKAADEPAATTAGPLTGPGAGPVSSEA